MCVKKKIGTNSYYAWIILVINVFDNLRDTKNI